jgi:hypothetical protein
MVALQRLLPLLAALAITAAMAGPTTVAPPEAAAAASAPADTAPHAHRRTSAACAAHASASEAGGRITSKVRHIPDEGDPCADSRGVAPPLPR